MITSVNQFRWYGFIPFWCVKNEFLGEKIFVGAFGRMQRRKPARPDMWQDEDDDNSWEDMEPR